MQFDETDQALDEKKWHIGAASGDFYFRTLADDGTNGVDILTFFRGAGTAMSQASFGCDLSVTGTLTLTTALDETYGGTGQTTYATGDILYGSAANTLSKLTAGTNGHVLTLVGGIPAWTSAGSQTPWASDIDGAGFGLDNIDRLEIQDGTGADTATFTHGGVHFATDFVTTTDWKVYGLTGAFEINNQAATTSTLRIGESATLRGDGQDARIQFYAEQGGSIAPTVIQATGLVWQFQVASNNDVQWTCATDYDFQLRDGGNLVIFDSDDSDSVTMSHSGGTSPNRVFTIDMANTDYVDFTNIVNPGGVRIRDGAQLEIYDPTDTSYLVVNHDGTDVNWTGVNTTDFIVDGLTWFKMLAGGGMAIYDSTNADEINISHDGTYANINTVQTDAIRIQDSVWIYGAGPSQFRIYDATGADYIQIAHDGTDVNLSFNQTTAFNINGADATTTEFADSDVYFRNGANRFYGVAIDTLTCTSADGWCNVLSCAAGNGRGGGTLFISHTGGTGAPDMMEVKVLATWDAESPSCRIVKNSGGTGITQIRMGYDSATNSASVDVQVSQGTSTTYKLIWRPYNISTDWLLTPSTTGSTVTSSRTITVNDGHMWSLFGGSADTESLWFHPGTGFRIGDGSQTDYVQFDHDGTDFRLTGTNTVDIEVNGLTGNLKLVDAGVTINGTNKLLSIANTALTKSFNIQNDDTDNLMKTFGTGVNVRIGNYGTATGFVSVEDGYSFRVYDSSNTDYADFDHDGTDFNTTFVNTTEWNIGTSLQVTGGVTSTGDMTADNFEATGLGPLTTPGTDDAYVGGYGLMGDRTNPIYISNVSGPVQLNHGGVHGAAALALATQDVTATGNTTAAIVEHHDGTAYDIGLMVTPNSHEDNNRTLSAVDAGKYGYWDNGSNYNLVTEASSTQDFPIGARYDIINRANGIVNINAGTGCTIYWAKGDGTFPAGNRDLSYGWATLLRHSATVWFLTGNGIT
jgi:hypothetical protein